MGLTSGAVRDRVALDSIATERLEAEAAVQAGHGFVPDASTIGTELGDRLDRAWAVGVICHNEEVYERRN